MAKKIKQIKVGGVIYNLKDEDLNILVNALLGETLSTNNQQSPNEKFWVPTTTDKASWDSLKVLKFFNLKGSVNSFTDLPESASTGDVYLIANSATGFTEEWVKTDNSWEMLGTVSNNVDITNKADKTEVKNLFDGFTATLLSGSTDEYLLTIPEAEIDATTNALQVKVANNGN